MTDQEEEEFGRVIRDLEIIDALKTKAVYLEQQLKMVEQIKDAHDAVYQEKMDELSARIDANNREIKKASDAPGN